MKKYLGLTIMLCIFLSVIPAMAVPQPSDPGAPTGDSIVPILYLGNPTLESLYPGYDFYYKIEPPNDGTYNDPAGGLSFVLDEYFRGGNQLFNFTSNIPVDVVLVKGGTAADAFVYIPPDTADTGLHAPVNPSSEAGFYYGLSHVSVAYNTNGGPNGVPEPTTLILLGAGLIGLVGLSIKFKARD